MVKSLSWAVKIFVRNLMLLLFSLQKYIENSTIMALDLHRKYIERKQESAPLKPIKDIVNSKYCLDPLELLGERSFNEPREVDQSEIGTPVQEFYRGSVIFLTGGTGFMGKALLEKLLRSCPHIKHIYLLIRSKKGKNVEQRLEDIFEDRVITIRYLKT